MRRAGAGRKQCVVAWAARTQAHADGTRTARVHGKKSAGPSFTTRSLLWIPYCALFATLFFPPQTDDLGGLARFIGIVAGTAVITMLAGALLSRRGAERARGLYSRAVTPYSLLVLALVVGTLIINH